jgi:ribose 1,5-bisphosphokinase PhnN
MTVGSPIPALPPRLKVGDRVQTTDKERWQVILVNDSRAVLHSTRRKYRPQDRSVSPYADIKRL